VHISKSRVAGMFALGMAHSGEDRNYSGLCSPLRKNVVQIEGEVEM
jgi:hypothetical protein